MAKGRRGFTMYEVFIVLAIIGIIAVMFRGAFVGPETAIRAAENMGFQNIQVVEKNWFLVGLRGCDERDAAKFVIRATNVLNKEVTFEVCTGWPFKGATIRSN